MQALPHRQVYLWTSRPRVDLFRVNHHHHEKTKHIEVHQLKARWARNRLFGHGETVLDLWYGVLKNQMARAEAKNEKGFQIAYGRMHRVDPKSETIEKTTRFHMTHSGIFLC